MTRHESALGTVVRALTTPCLLLDACRMDANIARLKSRLEGYGVRFRPHLKTSKSIEIARRVMESESGPCTVSTLREAEYFSAAGVTDICYAVGIAPAKLDRVVELRRQGVDLSIILDDAGIAREVAEFSRATGERIPALIEIDSDGRRGGVKPHDAETIREIGRAINGGGGELRGILTHAGASYAARSVEELRACAELERSGAVAAAAALREAGLSCPVVSIGSTPTAHFGKSMKGVTEVRAGVFVFFDLTMEAAGVCRLDDIALSVMASVIGERPDRGAWIVDAGWTALSRDLGASDRDNGYGLVCNLDGVPIDDLIVVETSQEHGLIAPRPGASPGKARLARGARVRILPNHACATAAQHARYLVLSESGDRVDAVWPRFGGW